MSIRCAYRVMSLLAETRSVGQQNGRLLMAEVEDDRVDGTHASAEPDGLFVNPRSAVLASGDVERRRSAKRSVAARTMSLRIFGERAPEGEERDAHSVQLGQPLLSSSGNRRQGPSGINSVGLFPELDEAEDLTGLLAFAQIGIGVAESPAGRILGHEDQDARLTAAPHRDIVASRTRGDAPKNGTEWKSRLNELTLEQSAWETWPCQAASNRSVAA